MSLILIALAAAATAAAPPAPPKVDCHDQAHRALDFWIGDWTVSDTRSGTEIAHSRIDSLLGGCAIKESFSQTKGPGGQPFAYEGASYTALNAVDGQWKQFYVDTGGNAAAYVGGPRDGAMVLIATAAQVVNRMTYRAQPDGSVRQTGELSLDGGKTWAPGYDLTYRHP